MKTFKHIMPSGAEFQAWLERPHPVLWGAFSGLALWRSIVYFGEGDMYRLMLALLGFVGGSWLVYRSIKSAALSKGRE